MNEKRSVVMEILRKIDLNQKNNGAPHPASKVYSSSKKRGLNNPLFLGSSKAHLPTKAWRFRLIFEDNNQTLYYLSVFLLGILVVLLGIGYSLVDKNIFLLSPEDSGYGYGDCNGSIGFAEGTMVLMSDRYENIEEIEVGEMLVGYDSESEKKVPREVLEVVEEESCEVIKLVFSEGNDIIVTKGLFMSTSDGWKEVGGDEDELEVGDDVINDDTTKEVVAIIALENFMSIYNLKVEEEIYFIDDPIMVRNSPCVPDCEDKDCGNDGCGGSCGSCETGENCTEYICVDNSNVVNDSVVNDSSEEEEIKTEETKEKVVEKTVEVEVEESPKKLPVLKYVIFGAVIFVILLLLIVVGYLIYKIFKPSKKKSKRKGKRKKSKKKK
jgi:hypothetical protein